MAYSRIHGPRFGHPFHPPYAYYTPPPDPAPPAYGVQQGIPVGQVGAIPPAQEHHGYFIEECAYCGWDSQVPISSMRFRCPNCGRDQAVGVGFGKRNVLFCCVS